MEPKQIALVVTFDSSEITKEEALKRLNNIKHKLEEIIEEEFRMCIIDNDAHHETIFIDVKYDNWN